MSIQHLVMKVGEKTLNSFKSDVTRNNDESLAALILVNSSKLSSSPEKHQGLGNESGEHGEADNQEDNLKHS